jgi:D-arabinose 1-dehydrogenase-like Zn-dependent alcohol dehydrogenase
MKAAIIEAKGRLAIHDIPEPEVGDYDALCRLLFGATCTGTDLHLINDTFPCPIAYPTVLGHESIGQVVKTGAKVRNFKPGDLISRVGTPPDPQKRFNVNWGGFAEFGIARDHKAMREDGCPEKQWSAYRVNQVLPSDLDPREATMLITWRETFSFIHRMGMSPGKSLLVLGSGGNGIAFAAHTRNLGGTSVLVGSRNRENAARAAGATTFYDYSTKNLLDQLMERYPQGFDLIIDAMGRAGQLDAALKLCAWNGSAAVYGLDDFGKCGVNTNNARGTFTLYKGGYIEAEGHEPVMEFIRAGKLNACHWMDLDIVYPLDRITEAYDAVKTRKHIKALVALA